MDMAEQCGYCNKEIGAVDSCIATLVIRCRLEEKPRIPHAGAQRCTNCGVKSGGYHHPRCSVEMCPHCAGRWMMCYCSLIRRKE